MVVVLMCKAHISIIQPLVMFAPVALVQANKEDGKKVRPMAHFFHDSFADHQVNGNKASVFP